MKRWAVGRAEPVSSAFTVVKRVLSQSERQRWAVMLAAIFWNLMPAGLACGQEFADGAEQSRTDAPRGLSEQLVAYWSFDEQRDGIVPDGINMAHHGQLMGEAAITGNGKFGGALELRKPDSFMAVPASERINLLAPLAERTIGVWFRVDDKLTPAHKQVIYDEGGVNVGFNIYIFRGRLYAGCWCRPPQGPHYPGVWLGTDMIESTCWHHVTLVLKATDEYDDGAVRAYLDGQLFGSGPGIELHGHDDDGAVGTAHETTLFHDDDRIFKGQDFRGLIDEVRIYNRAFTEAEVKVLVKHVPESPSEDPADEGQENGVGQ